MEHLGQMRLQLIQQEDKLEVQEHKLPLFFLQDIQLQHLLIPKNMMDQVGQQLIQQLLLEMQD